MIGNTGSIPENIRKAFQKRILPRPTITQGIRKKVTEAYKYLSSFYSFLKPDIRMGAKVFEPTGLNRTNFAVYEKNFNSVLLGTLLNALINGSMIYFGPAGAGKTTTPELVGQVLFGLSLKEIEEATIYGHPNLTEEKMTASFNIPKLVGTGEREVIWSSWVLQFYRMLDEVNRTPPEITSILMQAVDRRRVSYAGEMLDMPEGPISATANYYDVGNFEMTPPFMDRFGISVHAEGLSPQDIDMIYDPQFGRGLDRKSFALGLEERKQVYAEIQSIGIDNSTLALLAHLYSGLYSCELAGDDWADKLKSNFGAKKAPCDKDKCGFDASKMVCSQINEHSLGRSALAMRDYARAFAWFLDRKSIDNEVMRIIFALVNAHRLSPSRAAMNGGESAEGVDIDRSRFDHKTFSFPHHIWDLGLQGFVAQNPIYTEIDRFYEEIAAGVKSAKDLLQEADSLVSKVGGMEDPAKWELLKPLHRSIEILVAQQG